PAARAGDSSHSLAELRDELSDLKNDLGIFVERLEAVSSAVTALEGRLGGLGTAPAGEPMQPAVPQLLEELRANGGIERYRDLQLLFDQLRGAPTDPTLQSRLVEQLPTLRQLLQTYVRALGLIRES